MALHKSVSADQVEKRLRTCRRNVSLVGVALVCVRSTKSEVLFRVLLIMV